MPKHKVLLKSQWPVEQACELNELTQDHPEAPAELTSGDQAEETSKLQGEVQGTLSRTLDLPLFGDHYLKVRSKLLAFREPFTKTECSHYLPRDREFMQTSEMVSGTVMWLANVYVLWVQWTLFSFYKLGLCICDRFTGLEKLWGGVFLDESWLLIQTVKLFISPQGVNSLIQLLKRFWLLKRFQLLKRC